MTKRMTAVPLLAMVLAASACGGVRKPVVELDSVELGSIGISGGTLIANVRVENPNPVAVRAEDLRYELFLRSPRAGDESRDGAWERLAAGTYDERITVGANATEIVRVPVRFRFADMGPAVSSVLRTGRFDYRATGQVRVRAAGFARDVPFRKTGTVMLIGGG